MTIEVLYPEICNFYGDSQNAEYLKACCPDATFVYTAFDEVPYFVTDKPDMILMGSMSEETQRRVIEKLLHYKSRLSELCRMDTVMLFTGNAADIFCRNIDYVTENIKVEGLGFFDIDARTDWFRRVNGKLIGKAGCNIVVGFRSQFAEYIGDNSHCYFIECERGFGLNENSQYEGMRKNNLICTQLLGPILPLNPSFTEYLLRLAGSKDEAAFREEALEAYRKRVEEFRNPDTVF